MTGLDRRQRHADERRGRPHALPDRASRRPRPARSPRRPTAASTSASPPAPASPTGPAAPSASAAPRSASARGSPTRPSNAGSSSGRTIAATTPVSITFTGVTNPSGNGPLSVSTTSDPAAQSTAIAVTAAKPLTELTVAAASLAPSATTRYVVRFAESSTGALSDAGNSRIRLTLHAGTSLAGWAGGTVQDETAGTTVGACSRLTDPDLECWLFTDRSIAAGHRLRITLENVKNPADAAPYRLKAWTTSDTPQVTSPDYAQGERRRAGDRDRVRHRRRRRRAVHVHGHRARRELRVPDRRRAVCALCLAVHDAGARARRAHVPGPRRQRGGAGPGARHALVHHRRRPAAGPDRHRRHECPRRPGADAARPRRHRVENRTSRLRPSGARCCDKVGGKLRAVGGRRRGPDGRDDRRAQGRAARDRSPPRQARRPSFSDGMFKVSQSGGSPRPHAHRDARLLGQARAGRGEEAQDAQAVGRREGPLPDQGLLQRRHRPRHQVARAGHLHGHADAGHAGRRLGSGLPAQGTIRLRAGKSYTAKRR